MILVKTEAGQRVMKDRSIPLLPRQRSAFILFDGKRTVDEVLQATVGLTDEDIETMVGQGLLRRVADAPAARAGSGGPLRPQAPPSGRSAQQRYKDAYPIATRLTSNLGLRGFRLNLAVEHVTTYEELAELAPRIREAVGDINFEPLDKALHG